MAYGENQTAIYKETSPGTFSQVTQINEQGIAAATDAAPEDNAGVNLEAFGEVSDTPFG